MDAMIAEYAGKLEMGEKQEVENMAVFPLFSSTEPSPPYLTLSEALEKRLLQITEVSGSGSVPELKVVNQADVPVFLLDGEELAGAKQNRVLNTSILLKEKSETVIPVSCTEAGRWSYTSGAFEESGTVMTPRQRGRKSRAVSASLGRDRQYQSDQSEVWDGVAELAKDARVSSPTGAMRDVYSARQNDLDRYVKGFEWQENQRGLLVFVNGKAAGFDVLSRDSAYGQLHGKLVKSYSMEALLAKTEDREKEAPRTEDAKAFLELSGSCEESKYESVGHGWDYRFQGPSVTGSALVHWQTVVHMAFFRVDEADKTGHISGYRRRRDFRIY